MVEGLLLTGSDFIEGPGTDGVRMQLVKALTCIISTTSLILTSRATILRLLLLLLVLLQLEFKAKPQPLGIWIGAWVSGLAHIAFGFWGVWILVGVFGLHKDCRVHAAGVRGIHG